MGGKITKSMKKTIQLNKKSVSVYVGKSVKLKLLNTKKKVTWSSNKKKVTTVSKKGVVKGKKPAITTQPTKTPDVTSQSTQTPVPTIVPTPDVRMVTKLENRFYSCR